MKHLVPVLAVVLTGCVIHSIEPFYTPKTQTLPEEVLGQWQLLQSYGDAVSSNNVRPWVIEANGEDKRCKLTTYDRKDVSATFDLTFFKIGNTLFLDFAADQVGDETQLNEYWAFAVHPVHGVCKVILETNRLQLVTLDYKWVEEGLTKKQLALPHFGTTNDLMLFSATTADWEALLRKYANDAGAFPVKRAFVLKRVTAKKAP